MNAKLLVAATLAVFAAEARAADLSLPKDGWASWQVDAVENAPAFCCFEWDTKDYKTSKCNLDGGHSGYGSHDHETTDSVRVYAKFEGGKVQRVRALAPSCPVESKTPIQKLENVSTDDSARWLNTVAGQAPSQKNDLGDDAMVALALHRGDLAFNALDKTARTGAEAEQRKRAIFWLTQVRGAPGAKVASDLMFSDKDAEVRKHAGFAIAQTKTSTATDALIRQGETDADNDVRAQAWFWLAQTGAPKAEASIIKAMNTESDDHVREQAVFALSQLPDGRATQALIATAENKALSREQRKRALFWLGQSEAPEAAAYLDKVLMGNTTASKN